MQFMNKQFQDIPPVSYRKSLEYWGNVIFLHTPHYLCYLIPLHIDARHLSRNKKLYSETYIWNIPRGCYGPFSFEIDLPERIFSPALSLLLLPAYLGKICHVSHPLSILIFDDSTLEEQKERPEIREVGGAERKDRHNNILRLASDNKWQEGRVL